MKIIFIIFEIKSYNDASYVGFENTGLYYDKYELAENKIKELLSENKTGTYQINKIYQNE